MGNSDSESNDKRWKRYQPYLLSGLWHVHTNITDGEHSVDELLQFATERKFPLIGFIEHIRKEPTYDFSAFYNRTKAAAADLDIECVVGCEAKVLDEDGTLDATNSQLSKADIVYAAYHSGSFDKSEYLHSAIEMLETNVVDVWAHPLLYPSRYKFELTESEVSQLIHTANENEVLLEFNPRYPSTLEYFVESSKASFGDRFGIIGYDLHNINEWTP